MGGQGIKSEKSRSLAMVCKADRPEGEDARQYEQVAPQTPGEDTILKSDSRSLESPRSKKSLHKMPKIVILTSLGVTEEKSHARESECIGNRRIETIKNYEEIRCTGRRILDEVA